MSGINQQKDWFLRYPETSGTHTLQRQLQQLFRLHDSGLDQSFIDALPVFYYRDIVGLKEPFDCPVCLSEFSDQDKLRLLPLCSHAFHIYCIDTWLLSNSTCPLCRGTLIGTSGLPIENPQSNFNISREISNGFVSNGEDEISSGRKLGMIEASSSEAKRVFSVRLGKFRSLNGCENGGETSSCNLDARRCYSMGAFQYVVGDSNLQVALSNGSRCSSIDVEEKKISSRTRGDSFSVSKIWLWSKRSRFPYSSNNANFGIPSHVDVRLPIHNTNHNV
ncbi:RING-H2 finger protein ATL46-like [Tripterygium wilfordii]|uniref:RING-type E3 ubiquitin transferase n=1 Tax=Tripterygium wilfordii TaxID=458696 RepID=A0A7J7CL02_TRIWF|nr:RING-H2 finger protein ATL46-like [Tripterygium wilfordii]